MTTARRGCALLIASCWVITACGSGGTAEPAASTSAPVATSTSPSSSPSTSEPVATSPPTSAAAPESTLPDASSTTLVPVTTAPATSIPEPPDDMGALYKSATPLVSDDAACQVSWTELEAPTGEVTFARDGDLFSFDPGSGEVHCLTHVDRDPISLDWNPAGNRLLVDQDLIVTAAGQNSSGFEPATTGLSWSQPSGTALIAPAADGTSLRHIDADDPTAETDVSSLAETWAAAYHPSGLAIVSAGVAHDGTIGLFLADNRGNDPQTLVFLQDPATTITEVAFAPDGDSITFIHDHTGGTIDEGVTAHIHRLQVAGLVLEDLESFPDAVPRGLIASEQADRSVAWQTPYNTNNVQTTTWADGATRSLRFPETVADPIGFLDGGTAAAVVFPVDQAGNRQLWLYPPDRDPVLVARNVTAAATRTVPHPDWSPPPLDIQQQAVG